MGCNPLAGDQKRTSFTQEPWPVAFPSGTAICKPHPSLPLEGNHLPMPRSTVVCLRGRHASSEIVPLVPDRRW
jgi:hypothetical protein